MSARSGAKKGVLPMVYREGSKTRGGSLKATRKSQGKKLFTAAGGKPMARKGDRRRQSFVVADPQPTLKRPFRSRVRPKKEERIRTQDRSRAKNDEPAITAQAGGVVPFLVFDKGRVEVPLVG